MLSQEKKTVKFEVEGDSHQIRGDLLEKIESWLQSMGACFPWQDIQQEEDWTSLQRRL